MKVNNIEVMIAKLGTLSESKKRRLLAAIKHQALIEIRSALKHPIHC